MMLDYDKVLSMNGSIIQHLVDHEQHVHLAFNIARQISANPARDVRLQLLSTVETFVILIHEPDLCKQIQLLQTLHPPWTYSFYQSPYDFTINLICYISFK